MPQAGRGRRPKRTFLSSGESDTVAMRRIPRPAIAARPRAAEARSCRAGSMMAMMEAGRLRSSYQLAEERRGGETAGVAKSEGALIQSLEQ